MLCLVSLIILPTGMVFSHMAAMMGQGWNHLRDLSEDWPDSPTDADREGAGLYVITFSFSDL